MPELDGDIPPVEILTALSLADEFTRKLGGGPWRPRRNAFILSARSCEILRPLPRLPSDDAGGLREALMLPNGVDDVEILGVDNIRAPVGAVTC